MEGGEIRGGLVRKLLLAESVFRNDGQTESIQRREPGIHMVFRNLKRPHRMLPFAQLHRSDVVRDQQAILLKTSSQIGLHMIGPIHEQFLISSGRWKEA